MKKITNTSTNPNPEWLFGLNPNAIEQQEANGQIQLVESSQLPKEILPRDLNVKEEYEKRGIEVISETQGDDLFFDVKLPIGWNIKPTEHPMWNDLFDSNDKKVAAIFYKAAFYDRRLNIRFED